VAERDEAGGWQRLTARPAMIRSGNSIDHALLMLVGSYRSHRFRSLIHRRATTISSSDKSPSCSSPASSMWPTRRSFKKL
jgi:hypothetical protein